MGTCRRPSCTAMVCPTICGKMVLARLQVRMTFLSPRWFIASIFFSSLGSTNGPFLSERDMAAPDLPALLAAPLDDELVRLLVVAGLLAARGFAPRAARARLADGLAALAAAVRVGAR